MWNLFKPTNSVFDDEKRVQSINFCYLILVAFVVIWMVGAYFYLKQKTELSIDNPPVVVLDAAGLTISNLFNTSTNSVFWAKDPKKFLTSPMLEVKNKYSFGDVVIIKFFYVKAVVLTKEPEDSYTVLYRNHNKDLQKITLPRLMLMSPGDYVSPFSLPMD